MVLIPPPPPGLPPGGRAGVPLVVPAAVLPSAAAAAGAAAAALLQRQLAQDGAVGRGEKVEGGWTEHQTGDGRKFYFHEESQTSTWEKPDVLMTPEERANDTKWREYKIWDGRVFYHNRETKVSCWSMPPELRKARGEASGIDDRPLQLTSAEQRRAFWDLMNEKGIDEAWTWKDVSEATDGEPQAEALDERTRKQCFAELLSLCLRQKQIEAREKERNAAGALERLIEERFSRPEDLGTTYDEAAGLLGSEEAWTLIRSDVRRDEVFQAVMERLEEKHRKARADKRTERVVRLQRLMASDPELRRARLRWKDAEAILVKRDELQDEEPPLEALRVWASLRDLRHASEHEADSKAKLQPDNVAYREDRKRRDDFVACLKEAAAQGLLTPETLFAEFEAITENEPRRAALHDGPGATAMELFDEFLEDLRLRGAEAYAGTVVPASAAGAPDAPAGDPAERPAKRPRTGGWSLPEMAEGAAGHAEEAPDATASVTAEEAGGSALDELIASTEPIRPREGSTIPSATLAPAEKAMGEALTAGREKAASSSSSSSAGGEEGDGAEEDDPLMDAAARAAAEKAGRAEKAAAVAPAPCLMKTSGTSALDGAQDPTIGTLRSEALSTQTTGILSGAGDLTDTGAPTSTGSGEELPGVTANSLQAAPEVGSEATAEDSKQPEDDKDTATEATTDPSTKLSSAELLAKRVDDLRAMCRDRGLPMHGRKQEIVDRLLAV
uniref:Uncharacterized protein n=1 Tax=Pyrodinium bahamense TaxID=73915 RepID=A0A7S0B6J5_9DINO|mmetsp:Transcript_52282/g.144795  ORF Transcript_52282/g.144795 Transcript_52282/m.144795 type:complete len:729 (+) Transcript_52282:163-2349(+)